MQRSIDRSEDVYVEYPVRMISVAVLVAVVYRIYFFSSLLCFMMEGVFIPVNCNTELWSLPLE